jgi:hypothetical protein
MEDPKRAQHGTREQDRTTIGRSEEGRKGLTGYTEVRYRGGEEGRTRNKTSGQARRGDHEPHLREK